MNKRIVYKTDDGQVAIIFPVPNCGLTVEEIALKDVPTGKPFKIVDLSDLPFDGPPMETWDIDEADLTDGFGADYGVGSTKPFAFKVA